jgi:DMSO reductase anchor subunit
MVLAMKSREQYNSLIAFTSLAPLSVGGLLGLLMSRVFMVSPDIDWEAIIVLIIGILALFLSVFHLGRPWRAPLAILHLSTSWLSREVLLFGLFLVSVVCYTILSAINMSGQAIELVGVAGALFGLASTIATGAIYRLHSRPSWDQWLTIINFLAGALSTGVLFGFFIAHEFDAHLILPSLVWVVATMLLTFSLVISFARSVLRHPASTEAQLSRKLALGSHRWLLIIRIIAVIGCMVMIWSGNEAQFLAWIPALIGEFADRMLFFNTVIPVTLRGRYI